MCRVMMTCPAADFPEFGAVIFFCGCPAFLLRKFRGAFSFSVSLLVNLFLLLFFRKASYSAAEHPKGSNPAAELAAV
ncbi:hypothetical protein Y032_0058g2922 [Ancylostoma ceylanicum]|uniref:Uncharacterized protein n=1 Tax=Ancylostoma ceylanicum TaxID=53326 RepID=A0A016U4B0_9BILA|nr:hypothetical protein Y032_0058g2922 [Ancylostoma ceylanicum]